MLKLELLFFCSIMTVREIIIHPEWNYTESLQYDYAILRTEENITFSNRANAACLPNWTNSSKTDGQKLTISGWGAIAKGQINSE